MIFILSISINLIYAPTWTGWSGLPLSGLSLPIRTCLHVQAYHYPRCCLQPDADHQRRELHRAIAEWYEAVYDKDLSPVYSLLAYHWNQTEEANKAVNFLKAGEQAVHNFANQEAVTLLSAALIRADEASLDIVATRRAHWELLLGEAYVNLAEYVQGRQHIETGLALLGQQGRAID